MLVDAGRLWWPSYTLGAVLLSGPGSSSCSSGGGAIGPVARQVLHFLELVLQLPQALNVAAHGVYAVHHIAAH